MHPKIRQSAAEFESVYVTADGAPRVLDCRNQNIPRLGPSRINNADKRVICPKGRELKENARK
jgi:hypothetical protein